MWGGPQTIAALKADEVQIGLLFSTDPSIREDGCLAGESDQTSDARFAFGNACGSPEPAELIGWQVVARGRNP